MAAQQGEIGHRFQIVQIRQVSMKKLPASDRCTSRDQIGQAVEHVIGPASGLFDGFVNDGQERLEAIAGPAPALPPRLPTSAGWRRNGNTPACGPGAGVLAKRLDQWHVIVDAVHLPDDIVARHHPRNTGPDPPARTYLCVNRRHHALPIHISSQ